MPTKSQIIASDLAALLRARNPLLWVVSREEARVERYIVEAAAAAGYGTRTWDSGKGVTEIGGQPSKNIGSQDVGETLRDIEGRAEAKADRTVYIMRDLHEWLQGPIGIQTRRQLRNLARKLPSVPRDGSQALVVLSPSSEIPAEIAAHAVMIEWPLPDREEIGQQLEAVIASLPASIREQAAPDGQRDAAIDAAVGLSGEEAASCYAKSLVQHKRIEVATVAAEKKRVVAKEGLIEWFDPLPGGLDSVGGLDVMKGWLKARQSAYSPQARAYGLPSPKGVVLVGIPGCGKSLSAKACATAWNVPLLRLDLNAMKGKFVGQSEANIRKAFKTIEAIGRCVVWIDELEKALAGATSASADGGVSADALGTLLNWMQERQGEAFVIATANDVEGLPPEVLRKGRFDEVFFVDLPTTSERMAVLDASLRQFKRNPLKSIEVAKATGGFTGAEIAALVPEAMFAAFNDGGRELTVSDLLRAAQDVVPLAKTAAEKISKLRAWARGRARNASPPSSEGQELIQMIDAPVMDRALAELDAAEEARSKPE